MEENFTLKEKCKQAQEKFNFMLDSDKPILLHIDGRSFSRLVKNRFNKPFDDNFIYCMNETARFLCEEIQGCKLAYVQSDEITLYLSKDRPESEIFFGGRLNKIISICASLATSKFNQLIHRFCESDTVLYQFDCKAWNVENEDDVWRWFLFRNIDCVRNSKNQTAFTFLSHKKTLGKTSDELVEILKNDVGVDWSEFDDSKKYGRIVHKIQVEDRIQNKLTKEWLPVNRTKWTVDDGMDLTVPENREMLKELSKFQTNGND